MQPITLSDTARAELATAVISSRASLLVDDKDYLLKKSVIDMIDNCAKTGVVEEVDIQLFKLARLMIPGPRKKQRTAKKKIRRGPGSY